LLEDEPGIEVMVVPIGGGGLISGMAAMAKALNPAIEVVGIEAEASCPFLTSRRLGRLERIVPKPTLADGLAGNPDPDTITFSLIQRSVDRIVTVNEGQLADAIFGLIESEHVIAEGAGAAGVAALVGRRVDVAGRNVAVVVSGANIDRGPLESILDSAPRAQPGSP